MTLTWLILLCCLHGLTHPPSGSVTEATASPEYVVDAERPPDLARLGGRPVAVTFDDLPGTAIAGGNCEAERFLEVNRRLLTQLERLEIPATGFVTETRVCDALRDEVLPTVLAMWLDAGHDLGNHTYSHLDLNTTPLERYIRDIVDGERTVRRLLADRDRTLRFFRHPLLHTGPDASTKAAVAAFLDARGYAVAPVTIDNQEWIYSAVYARAKANGDFDTMLRVSNAYVPFIEEVFSFFEEWSVEVMGREIPHVLLLHANELNADHFERLSDMIKRRGYRFVSLADALRDEAYGAEDGYVGPRGLSWLHRWARAKGMNLKEEPREPEWLGELFRTYRGIE